MKLSEARALYVHPKTRPLDNRKLNTALKKALRRKAELLLEKPWDEIVHDYDGIYSISGSPARGNATLTLKEQRVCLMNGALRPTIVISFLQKELFEPSDENDVILPPPGYKFDGTLPDVDTDYVTPRS